MSGKRKLVFDVNPLVVVHHMLYIRLFRMYCIIILVIIVNPFTLNSAGVQN